VCEKHGIDAQREKPLHSLMGEYIKVLKSYGLVDSVVTERILKSTISVLEAFSTVRNDESLAHDNPVLNYNESLLVLSQVISIVRYMRALEKRTSVEKSGADPVGEREDDLPF
jgi:hypothetical protein